MYRKLVFVLTMFAVAFGSLSGAQAALASPRQPARVASAAHTSTAASITTHSATGPVRAAAASRQMAHRPRLRTGGKQRSLPLSSGRRTTETASAPTITRAAPLAAPKNTSAGPAFPPRPPTRAQSPALPAPPLPSARPGPLPSCRPGCPRAIDRGGHTADGGLVHHVWQPSQHGDIGGNTGCGLPPDVHVHDPRHERYRS